MKNRYKIIVLFNSGILKELLYTIEEGKFKITLEGYLKDYDNNETFIDKMPYQV